MDCDHSEAAVVCTCPTALVNSLPLVCYPLGSSITSPLLYYLPPDYTCLPKQALLHSSGLSHTPVFPNRVLPAPTQRLLPIGSPSDPGEVAGLLPIHPLHRSFLLNRFSTLKIEVIRSSETLVHIQTTLHDIPQNVNIHWWIFFFWFQPKPSVAVYYFLIFNEFHLINIPHLI
jgi:hypothetical protein